MSARYPSPAKSRLRCTVVGGDATVSFLAGGHAGKMLTAACSFEPGDVDDVLRSLALLDDALAAGVRRGLARFDEFCLASDPTTIDRWRRSDGSGDEPFRVVSPELRQASLAPGPLGVLVFNLPERRIVQLVNRYGELQRSDRGRIRVNGRPTNRYYVYELPDRWRIVP